jgi:hypothetical protein
MDLSFYDDSKYTGIRGVVIKNKNKWKIIDGYHRLSKTEMPKVKVISCVKHCL